MKMIRHIVRALLLGVFVAGAILIGSLATTVISFASGSRLPVEPFRTVGGIAEWIFTLPVAWIRPPHDVGWKHVTEILLPIIFWGAALETVWSWGSGRIGTRKESQQATAGDGGTRA